MANSKRRPAKFTQILVEREVAKLQESGERLPGVADLIQRYQQHARTVRRAGAYQLQAHKRMVITSGASRA